MSLQFITDRTQAHVDLLNRLRRKNWVEMTASEQTAWYGEAAKGAYNHTDFNRVETAVAEIAEILGLALTTKTDWTVWDIPLQADMERYLSNVMVIRDAAPVGIELPMLPDSMGNLTYEGANSIEKVLELVYEAVNTPE